MNQDKKEITRGEVLDFNNLIQYQKDSVVSRTLIQKQTGNMTLFAFDKDQGLSEHTAPFDALVYILDGKAQVAISKETFLLKKGEAIIMPADKPHALKAIERFKMALVMIRS